MIRSSHTRRGRAAAAIAVAALAVAATSMGAHASSPPTAPAGSAGPSGGTLAFGITTDPDTLFPWKATQFQAVNLLQNIYGTLTEFDQDLNVVPGLATSWDTSDDGLTVTLHLRDGVVFDDGSAFDSADVVDSLTKIQDEATAAVAASTLANVTGIDAPDPSTVVLTLSAPDAALIAGLASVNIAMLSSDDTEDALNTTPNGTGPYAFDSRVPAQSITLVANENYWGDAPTLGQIDFRVIPEESSIVSALQSGNVQMAVLNDPLVAQTAEGGGVTVAATPQLSYHALMLNATPRRPHRRQRAPRHPVRHRPPGGARHGGVRRGRDHRPDHVAGLPLRPQLAAVPHTRSRQGGRVPRRRRQAGRRHDPHHRVAG